MKTADEPPFSLSAPVVHALSTLVEVKGILCFGSYAMGFHDPYSDIDLYIFCEPEVPRSAARLDTLQKVAGIERMEIEHTATGCDDQWAPTNDRFWLGGLQFDLTYNRVDWLWTIVRKVKEDGAISIPELRFRPYTMLGLLDNSVILYDPDSTLQEIMDKLQPYPIKLRQALLTQNLPVMRESLEELQNYTLRDIGNTAFLFHLNRILDALGTALFALNGRYDPATKRIEAVLGELAILPVNFLQRYNQLLETPLTSSGRQQVVIQLSRLVSEVEELAN